MNRLRGIQSKKRKRGFTLIECIVSIAIFAIMGTMFATFMVSSVRVVNLTLANDRDREALLEAIAAANSGTYETEHGTVTIQGEKTNGKRLDLSIQFDDADAANRVRLEDKFVTYEAPNGTKYRIYLGASAMSVKYLVIANLNDNQVLLDAINAHKKATIQVTYKDEKDYFFFDVDATAPQTEEEKKEKWNILEIHNDDAGNPEYLKYILRTGEKYLIYFYKEPLPETNTP